MQLSALMLYKKVIEHQHRPTQAVELKWQNTIIYPGEQTLGDMGLKDNSTISATFQVFFLYIKKRNILSSLLELQFFSPFFFFKFILGSGVTVDSVRTGWVTSSLCCVDP